MDPKKQSIIIVLVAVIATAGIVGGVMYAIMVPSEEGEADVLEIYHWWTSGGEAAAIGALVDVFEGLYPDTTVKQRAISGGSGITMIPIITALVLAGEAPDAFQMHAGYEGIAYYEADLLEDINDIWTDNNLEAVIPDVVQSMCQFEGDYYMVPVNIHRSNVVWYNLDGLEAVGVDPKTLTNWTAFFDACDDYELATGNDAIALGHAWTQAHLFEQILASQGIDVYEDWINGLITNTTDADISAALDILTTFMSYTNADFNSISWNEATDLLIQNNSAFNIMGDWANGEFLVANSVYDVDYGTIAVPGTGNMYGLVVDAFQHPAGVANPENSDRWLEVVASKDGQDAFNPLKGSISARTDSNLTLYEPYHDWTGADFASVTTVMFPSVVHGSGAPQSFSSELNAIINAFCTGAANKATTAAAIADLAADNAADFTTVWALD